jgi:hypothetical protein
MTLATSVGEGPDGYPESAAASYDLKAVHQLQATRLADVAPASDELRARYLSLVAAQAVLYGWASVLQYATMYAQAVDTTSAAFTGFSVCKHDRALAGPGYRDFKTPNADTLYSSAWLDLRSGPVEIDVPAFHERYYTLNFLDFYSNATNISTLTAGGSGGRYLVALSDWEGDIPEGAEIFRVATEFMWLLVRVQVAPGDVDDLAKAHRLQDSIRISAPVGGANDDFVAIGDDDVEIDSTAFFRTLGFLLDNVRHPVQEDALVYQFRALGLGVTSRDREVETDEATRRAMDEGFTIARSMILDSGRELGYGLGDSGWARGHPGAYGFNYLRRAATNQIGLGATVRQENQAFMCWRDARGDFLDGSGREYRLTFAEPPPVDAFWSVTVYSAATRELCPNELGRYSISNETPGVVPSPGGGLTIRLSAERPDEASNWLPVPAEPFYLALRAYAPRPEVLAGDWRPPAVEALK